MSFSFLVVEVGASKRSRVVRHVYRAYLRLYDASLTTMLLQVELPDGVWK